MNIEELKETLASVKHYAAFGSAHLQFTPDFKLFYIECQDTKELEEPDKYEVSGFYLSCEFLGRHYTAETTLEDIKNDIPEFSCAGPSVAFDSFKSYLEEEVWEHIKLSCLKFNELYINGFNKI